jgi:hypothetical protein
VLSKAGEVVPVLKTFLDRPEITKKPARRYEPAAAQ